VRANGGATGGANALGAEIASLDRARSALQGGNASAALAELADYEQQFPERQLNSELLVLRMEAFAQSGQRDLARELARELLSGTALPPHAARARVVLGASLTER
jgi:hypothetical protein